MKRRKTWREKLEGGERGVVDDLKGRGKMLIPKPLDIDVLIRSASELLIQIRVRNKLQVLVSGDLSGVG